MLLITNRNNTKRSDRFEYYLREACKNNKVKIAVAFFTDTKIIDYMLENGCEIELIVRLNDGTSPSALSKVYNKKGLAIKYYSSRYFHPKLYLIPNKCAFIGSSNLTDCALNKNNEVNLKVDYENDEQLFTELEELFSDYWQNAAVLDNTALSKFENVMKNRPVGYRDFSSEIGLVEFNNVKDENKKDKKNEFINEFKIDYLNYVNAFNKLKDIYSITPERRWSDLPLRVEVDRFLWWIGETQYKGSEWNINKKYQDEKIKQIVLKLKPDFLLSDNKWLVEQACENYNLLNNGFETKEKLNALNKDDLFTLLSNVYSFHDSLRYHKDGLETLKFEFFEANNLEDIKKTISHLLFDKEPFYERLYDCIHGQYKLDLFGQSSVKELFGYVNKEDYPIYNGRIRRSMSYLGFGLF